MGVKTTGRVVHFPFTLTTLVSSNGGWPRVLLLHGEGSWTSGGVTQLLLRNFVFGHKLDTQLVSCRK